MKQRVLVNPVSVTPHRGAKILGLTNAWCEIPKIGICRSNPWEISQPSTPKKKNYASRWHQSPHFLINTMTKDPTNLHDQDEECQSQKKEIKVNSLDLSTKNKSLAFNNTSSVPSENWIEMQCYGNISICKTISMSLFLVCFLGTGGTYLATWWSNRSQGKQLVYRVVRLSFIERKPCAYPKIWKT